MAESSDQRLLIEEDEATGGFVYRTVDRRTGEVLQELDRDELLKLGEDEAYAAGGVIRTKA